MNKVVARFADGRMIKGATTDFAPGHPPTGRKIKVVFKDGEELAGTSTGDQPGRPGFFLVPVDADSNNERCYVITAFTQEISFI
ncbi:MAG: hypothetical protein WBN66_04070 [Smithella sp.]